LWKVNQYQIAILIVGVGKTIYVATSSNGEQPCGTTIESACLNFSSALQNATTQDVRNIVELFSIFYLHYDIYGKGVGFHKSVEPTTIS
jgi:hypothetical protein